MQILALVTDAFGQGGGIARYNRDFLSAAALSADVEHITILPRCASGTLETPEKVTQCAAQKMRVSYAAVATKLALRRRPHLIFCGHLHIAPLALILSRVLGVPYWLQIHGIEAWTKPAALRRRAIESANRVLFVSRYSRKRALDWANVDWDRTAVISNTVDDAFRPAPRREDLRAGLGLAGGRVLLTVGRMSAAERYKGHDLVIQALPSILRSHPDILYVIVGDGDDRPRLQHLAEHLRVADRVRFAGAVPAAELPDYYRLADLFVMPSTGEGFGIVYLEAMACGVPALGTGLDGSCDALRDGDLGISVGKEALDVAICGALREHASIDRVALAAQVRELFGQDRFRAAVHAELQHFALDDHTGARPALAHRRSA